MARIPDQATRDRNAIERAVEEYNLAFDAEMEVVDVAIGVDTQSGWRVSLGRIDGYGGTIELAATKARRQIVG